MFRYNICTQLQLYLKQHRAASWPPHQPRSQSPEILVRGSKQGAEACPRSSETVQNCFLQDKPNQDSLDLKIFSSQDARSKKKIQVCQKVCVPLNRNPMFHSNYRRRLYSLPSPTSCQLSGNSTCNVGKTIKK